MLNSFELLSKHLHEYNVKTYIHNLAICDFRDYEIVETEVFRCFQDKIYVVTSDTDLAILKRKNINFLMFDFQYARYDNLVDISSNVMVVSRYGENDIPKILSEVEVCFQAFRRFDKQLYRLFNASLRSEYALENLLNTSADILENPLKLFDPYMQTIGKSANMPDNEDIHYLRSTGQVILENPLIEEPDYNLKDIIHNVSYVLYKKVEPDKNYLTAIIYVKGVRLYGLSCLAVQKPFAASDTPLLFLLANMLSEYMTLYSIQNNVPRVELANNFFRDILSNKIVDAKAIRKRAKELNIKLSRHNYILILFRNDGKKVSRNDILAQYARVARNTSHFACMHENHIVILVTSKNEIEDFTECNWGIDVGRLQDNPLNQTMVSLSFPDLTCLRATYLQCSAILSTITGRKDGKLLYYSDYMYQGFINQILYTNEKKTFNMPMAEKILRYDEENATAYGITILHYLKHYMRIIDAAESLNIHKNSLVYRIRRSTELFDIDFSNHSAMNALQLSLEVLLYNIPKDE